MNLYDLVHKHAWEDIQAALVRLYPDHESELDGYRRVFEKLQGLSPVQSPLRLLIQLVYSEHTQEFHIEMKGIGPDQKDGGTGSLFGLEFTPWEKWLGMELAAKTLEDFSEFDILAHCLYEMTLFGFTQDDIKAVEEKMMESGTSAQD